MPSKNVFVTGATGNIGAEVVRQLVALGERVRVLSRDCARASVQLGPNVEVIEGDLTSRDGIDRWFVDCDRLFLLAHAPELPNVSGPVFDAAKRAGVRHRD